MKPDIMPTNATGIIHVCHEANGYTEKFLAANIHIRVFFSYAPVDEYELLLVEK